MSSSNENISFPSLKRGNSQKSRFHSRQPRAQSVRNFQESALLHLQRHFVRTAPASLNVPRIETPSLRHPTIDLHFPETPGRNISSLTDEENDKLQKVMQFVSTLANEKKSGSPNSLDRSMTKILANAKRPAREEFDSVLEEINSLLTGVGGVRHLPLKDAEPSNGYLQPRESKYFKISVSSKSHPVKFELTAAGGFVDMFISTRHQFPSNIQHEWKTKTDLIVPAKELHSSSSASSSLSHSAAAASGTIAAGYVNGQTSSHNNAHHTNNNQNHNPNTNRGNSGINSGSVHPPVDSNGHNHNAKAPVTNVFIAVTSNVQTSFSVTVSVVKDHPRRRVRDFLEDEMSGFTSPRKHSNSYLTKRLEEIKSPDKREDFERNIEVFTKLKKERTLKLANGRDILFLNKTSTDLFRPEMKHEELERKRLEFQQRLQKAFLTRQQYEKLNHDRVVQLSRRKEIREEKEREEQEKLIALDRLQSRQRAWLLLSTWAGSHANWVEQYLEKRTIWMTEKQRGEAATTIQRWFRKRFQIHRGAQAQRNLLYVRNAIWVYTRHMQVVLRHRAAKLIKSFLENVQQNASVVRLIRNYKFKVLTVQRRWRGFANVKVARLQLLTVLWVRIQEKAISKLREKKPRKKSTVTRKGAPAKDRNNTTPPPIPLDFQQILSPPVVDCLHYFDKLRRNQFLAANKIYRQDLAEYERQMGLLRVKSFLNSEADSQQHPTLTVPTAPVFKLIPSEDELNSYMETCISKVGDISNIPSLLLTTL